MQIFEFLKKDVEVCKLCKQNTGSFKSYKYLNSVNKQDSFKEQCRNCVYAGNYSCAVRDDE